MDIIHLPREATRYINSLDRAVRYGREIDGEAEAAFRGLRESARQWIEFHGAYTLHEDEARAFDNVLYLWEQVDAGLEETDPKPLLEHLVPTLYEAVRCMDAINVERGRPHFSVQPALNDFIMAGTAVVIGRAQPRAVEDRIPVLEHYLVNLRSLYKGSAARIKAEVRDDLERGFQALEAGLETVRMAVGLEDSESLRVGLVRLQQGAGLVQHFLDWDRDDNARMAERFVRFHIPLVGPSFEHCLDAARATRRTYWRPAVNHVRGALMPRLMRWWQQVRPSVLLSADVRDERLSAVDQGLAALQNGIGTLLDERLLPEEALERVERALTALSDAFDALERDAIRREGLRGTAGETWCELISGLLAETVPDLAVARVVTQAAVPPGWEPLVERVRAYLDGQGEGNLLEAAQLLASKAQAAEQPVADTWTCPCCGALTALGDRACSHCDFRPSAAVAAATWEA